MVVVAIVIGTMVGTLALVGLGIKLGQQMKTETRPLTWFNLPKDEPETVNAD